MFENRTIKARLTFIEGLLGTANNNPDIHDEFIASKAPNAKSREEEIAAIGVEKYSEKSMTVFHRDDNGNPALFDYQIKGFFKDACGVLRKVKGSKSSSVKAYKKEIDGLVFVSPRMIPLQLPEGGTLSVRQRPLRASTMQGERITLSVSEEAPKETSIDIEITCLTDEMYDLVYECLDYGVLRGLGQWRNSGAGRFSWEELA